MRGTTGIGTLLLLAGLVSGCITAPHQHPSSLPNYALQAETDDGWKVSLFRFPPTGESSSEGEGTPVLLVPGTAMNRFAFIARGSDLADYLSSRGFDVWILEARGASSSTPPDLRSWRRGDWSIDDLADRDVPAALEAVRAETGRQEILWVGHSLGAVLAAIHLQRRPDGVRGLVALGMPGSLTQPNRIHRLARGARGLIPKRGPVPAKSLARAILPFIHLAPDSNVLHTLYNEENLHPTVTESIVRRGIENIGRGVALQLQAWVRDGHLRSVDEQEDYTLGMEQIETPVLLVAGRVDHVVPAWSVRAAYDAWGSADKEFVVLGRGWGQRFGYGHGDLVLGDGVAEELFPLVGDWLVARISGSDPEPSAEPAGGPRDASPEPEEPFLEDAPRDDLPE